LTGHYTPPGMKKSITADVIELKDLRR
jgi:hypothetical protein